MKVLNVPIPWTGRVMPAMNINDNRPTILSDDLCSRYPCLQLLATERVAELIVLDELNAIIASAAALSRSIERKWRLLWQSPIGARRVVSLYAVRIKLRAANQKRSPQQRHYIPHANHRFLREITGRHYFASMSKYSQYSKK